MVILSGDYDKTSAVCLILLKEIEGEGRGISGDGFMY